MRHDAMLGHGVRPHGVERSRHARGVLARPGRIALRERQQDLPPMPKGREFGRDGAERGESLERRPGLAGAGELEQRQRPLQLPVSGRAQLGRRLRRVEQCQGFGGALLLEQVGREIKPGSGVPGFARDHVAQEDLGRLGLSGNAQEGSKIGAGAPDGPEPRPGPDASPSWRLRRRPGDSGRDRS